MSFQSNDQWMESVDAGADLRNGGQFRFVELNANNQVTRCNAAKERAYGVLQNKPNSGEVAQVVKGPGGTLVEAGAALAIGDEVTTDAQGRAIKATAANDYVNGIAKEAASAAGDFISVDLTTYKL